MFFRSCQVAVLVAGTAAFAAITPVRIEQTVEPEFPRAFALSPISSGEARVVINVDDAGTLADLMVTGYTDKAFADEAVRVLKQWRYAAATMDGKPVGVRMELKFDFSATGRVVSLSVNETIDALMAGRAKRTMVSKVCRGEELDQPLMAVQALAPPKPAVAADPAGTRKSVLIDFYVDETGQPRMPVVLDFPPAAYAQSAVNALSQWRFAAPTRAGRPVVVRARQEFVFDNGS